MNTLNNERLEEISESVQQAIGVSPTEVQVMADRLLAAEAQLAASNQKAKNYEQVAHGLAGEVDMHKAQLAELRGQAVEPVGYITAKCQKLLADNREKGIFRYQNITGMPHPSPAKKFKTVPVYAERVPPATSLPVATNYRNGIEAAAKWIDKQREAFDNEHGRHDPDTGTFEFGNDAQLEHSSTLAELSEGIRALQPSAASQPYTVPDEPDYWVYDTKFGLDISREKPEHEENVEPYFPVFKSAPVPTVPHERIYRDKIEKAPGWGGDSDYVSYEFCMGWNACRAAMLQAGNSPIIPDESKPIQKRELK